MSSPWNIRNAFASYVPGSWVENALCAQADPELFFPEHEQSSNRAKLICRQCDVINECAEYALNSPTPLQGVWAGMTVQERKDYRKRRA